MSGNKIIGKVKIIWAAYAQIRTSPKIVSTPSKIFPENPTLLTNLGNKKLITFNFFSNIQLDGEAGVGRYPTPPYTHT